MQVAITFTKHAAKFAEALGGNQEEMYLGSALNSQQKLADILSKYLDKFSEKCPSLKGTIQEEILHLHSQEFREHLKSDQFMQRNKEKQDKEIALNLEEAKDLDAYMKKQLQQLMTNKNKSNAL